MENEFYYNTVLAALARPKSAMPHNKSAVKRLRGLEGDKEVSHALKEWEWYCQKTRQALNIATPVRLDNTVLRHIAELSVEPIEKLMKLLPQAELPFNDMWIEWDDHEKQKIFHEVAGEKIDYDLNLHSQNVGLMASADASRGGYEVLSFFDNLAEWEGQKWTTDDQVRAGTNCALVSFHIYPKGNGPLAPDLDSIAQMLFAETYKNGQRVEKYPKKLLKHCAVDHCPVSIPSWGQKNHIDALKIGMQMIAGDGRFLLCTLALLNYPHIVKLTATSPSKTRRIKFGAVVPRKEVKVVEIELPKSRASTTYKRLFTGQGSPKRLHQRRGHWRVNMNADGTERKPIWIAPMWVGNEEVGVIDHQYELKGRPVDDPKSFDEASSTTNTNSKEEEDHNV